jgi:hypothetical protein
MDFALEPSAIFASLLIPTQILFVNLLLSADNALVIAMACRGLPAEDVQRATLFGQTSIKPTPRTPVITIPAPSGRLPIMSPMADAWTTRNWAGNSK